MSESDSKPKPMPSAAVINAYLEQSAARTKMRLPIAKLAVPPPAAAEAAPAQSANRLPVQKSRALPTTGASAPATPSGAAASRDTSEDASKDGATWRPFGSDEER